ncbi:MAG TPA: glycosyltransferase [Candidatus Dormibacteraeota bacterium]|nr:glycosyltransferase [Candidatus Dormibacteraeota bacterium]
MIATITLVVLTATSFALLCFGVNLLYLTWSSTRIRTAPRAPIASGDEPNVCVQVPIYNERYVAERVIDAVCAMEWPHDRFEVQVLDDSDDETSSIVSRRATHWRRKGVRVSHVRRGTREGFKAGALAHGLGLTTAPFIAIFDADFVPPQDFLRRTLGVFDDPRVGFAQARWGHLNEGYSWFTRLQALAIDFHFLVEQAVRSQRAYFTNFTGTAGVWRRAAIDDAGGWSAATLTEDLDLSYRAQLRGWRAAFVQDLVVPEELPVSIDAYRRQQSRWATGSFQSAFILLVPVLRSSNRAGVKFQAAAHLVAYGVGPVMLLQLACYPLLLLTVPQGFALPGQLADASLLLVAVGVSPWIGFMVAQTRRGRPWWSGAPALLCQAVGAGMSLNTLIALVRATRRGGEFVRTPKHRIVERGQEWRDQAYVKVGDPRAAAEAVLGLAALSLVPPAIAANHPLLGVYSGLFAIGFLLVAALSALDLLEVVTLRRMGRRALGRLRAAGPAAGLLALCGLLLLLAAQMPEPFEDGYGHWLIAANLASTGNLHDPLFSMEDTWLPGYHVLAGAVLHLFGLWQIGALKAMSALLGLATLAFVYAFAPNVRQARMAVVLLLLNPVFLFTSGSAVVEPLMTALLMGAALAAVKGRMRLAVLLAALAAVTATKAWIWIGTAGGFIVIEQVHALVTKRSAKRIPAAAWAVPAIAVLVFMQLGFAPAGHSLARGSTEVFSATARGSIPGGALSRLLELGSTYGLAALPLFALGLVGLASAVRRPEVAGGKAGLRFLHVPSLVYLAAVFALVGAGAYSGSHRYLYPALPSLALLAAAVLDRQPALARVGAAAAGALLAIGFLPTFASFAAGNTGLIAAGHAAAGDRMLVTDSPVVAYYSGRLPTEIAGTQALPQRRDDAIEWMNTHEVAAVVLENVSYYKGTTLFPDLVSGRPAAPFGFLGEQARYQASGGKSVYAYRLGTALQTQPIYPGVYAGIERGPGEGKTSPLAKGLVLEIAGRGVAGEGMGFGVPIVQYTDGWVYSRTVSTRDLSTGTSTVWQRTYSMDEMGGDKAHGYQFVPIASRGEVVVTYRIDATGISVSVHVARLAAGYSEVHILNEESAGFNDLAADGSPTLLDGDISRWQALGGAWARLQSTTLGVQWSVPMVSGAQLFGGRELVSPDLNWAGLDYSIAGEAFRDMTYTIKVQPAR